jgi:hypothetical protein
MLLARAQPDAAAAYRSQAEQAALRGEADNARAEAAKLRTELAALRQQARCPHAAFWLRSHAATFGAGLRCH